MVFVWEGEALKPEGDSAELSAAKPTSPLPNNNKWPPPPAAAAAKPAPPTPKPSDAKITTPIHDDASSPLVVLDTDALQPNKQKELEPQKKGATKATPKPCPKHEKTSPGSPTYLTTAAIVLIQFVLLHRALLHFQPSSGALPILAPAVPSVSAYGEELTREEAETLSASVLHIGCALFFLWSGWKASHEFSFLAERRTLLPLHQKEAMGIHASKWLRKLVFKPLSTRMTIFLPAYMLTLTLVHILCSLSRAEESSAHFIFLHIHSCAHLFLYFPYALLLWIVHCPLFYAIKSEDAGNFSWRARLLAACTPLSLLLLGNCLPGEVDRAVLSSSILLIYGPILALLFMKRKLAVVRSSFKLLTVLIAGVIVYGGRLFIPTMSEWTISGSSLLAFTASVIVKYISLFVSNSALFVLGFAWSHMDSEANAEPASTTSKRERSQATLGVVALFSFLAASSVLVSAWDADGPGYRFSHDYLAFLLALIIKRFSRSSESVWERLIQDSSFLVFLIHPIFANVAAVIVASIGWTVFHSSLALLVGLSTILCYGAVGLTLLFAPSKISNLLVRFNNLYR